MIIGRGTIVQRGPSLEDVKKLEDEIRERCDGWDELRRATAYAYLHAQGMNLEKSKEIRRKAGATR